MLGLVDAHAEADALERRLRATHSPSRWTAATFGILIIGYSQTEHVERARATLDEMKALGLVPNSLALNALLNAHRSEQHFPAAVELYRQTLSTDITFGQLAAESPQAT